MSALKIVAIIAGVCVVACIGIMAAAFVFGVLAGVQKHSPSRPGLSPLHNEALSLAKTHFESVSATRGESCFTVYSLPMMGPIVVETKGLAYKVVGSAPTLESERLNGLEWQGKVNVVARVYRDKQVKRGEWKPWSEGNDGFGFGSSYSITKNNGQWKMSSPDFRAPLEHELPK